MSLNRHFRADFSFKKKGDRPGRQTDLDLIEEYKKRYANTVEVDDNPNDLIPEGEEDVDNLHPNTENAAQIPSIQVQKGIGMLYYP